MKKRIKFVLFIFIFMLFVDNAYALSVSNNSLTIEKGMSETISLYANTEEEINSVSFTLVYSTYDIPASFTPASGANDGNPNGIVHNVNFSEPQSGKVLIGTINISVKNYPTVVSGTVNIHSAKATSTIGNSISLNAQNINVTIGSNIQDKPKEEVPKEEEKKEKIKDNNLLEKIESKIVNIELKKDVFEYSVTIEKTIEELDLKTVAKDENTKVDISSQKISELKDDKIIITATNGDIKQEYTIKVKIKEEKEVVVDNTSFKADTSYKGKWIIMSILFIVILLVGLFLNNRKNS